MSGFIRRFTTDPGIEVLLEIESVNILDLEPPASIIGVGSGTVLCVGEFEDGPFDLPLEMLSGGDVASTFGGFGYVYNSVPGNHPCARSRKADGAITKEFWNGNGSIQLNGKKFKRLILTRADTSVGSIELRREAFVTGGSDFRFNLEPAQVLSLDIGAGYVSATFSAAAATVTSGAGTYPNGFVGGETLTLGYDGAPDFTVTFLAGDTTKSAVIARINTYAGFAFAGDGGTTLMTLTGLQRGAGGAVRVVAGSPGVLTALGLTAATTVGTGNVQNIDAVAYEEVKRIVEAAFSNAVRVLKDSSGRIRVSKVYASANDYIQVGPATTALGLGLAVDTQGANDGIANYRSGTQTFNTTGSGTLVLGVDEEPNFNVSIGVGNTQAVVIAAINAAAGYTMASSLSGTLMLLRGRAEGGQVRVVSAPAQVLTDLGLTPKTVSAPAQQSGILPAGTLVQTAAGLKFVTMQTISVGPAQGGITASGVGPYTVKIRHATDDGTGASATAGAINTTTDAPDIGSFQVVNPATTSAALTETQIDAVYVRAIETTKALDSAAAEANIIFSARQSNVIRRALRSNVLEASKVCQGRVACIRPPIGTSKTAARSNVAEPGVGAYRSQRVIYTFPQVNMFVPPIALRGTLGGEGFTADGNVNVGADGMMASILSQLAPEEDPGQLTDFTSAVNSLDTTISNLQMEDYIAFKASGIASPRMDGGVMIFQSGVTSVDPKAAPNLVNIARRRMADFIEDSVAKRVKSYSKRLSTMMRRKAVLTEIRAFADELLGRNGTTPQRIAGYSLTDKENTADTLGKGLYRIDLSVRNLASLGSIVIATTVGETVEVTEVLQDAA